MKLFIWIAALNLLLISGETQAQSRKNSEAYYVREWCARYAGSVETVQSDRTRVDCETYYHAIEFDFADKWAEAIGQALHYSIMTGKRAGMVLIVENPDYMRFVERAKRIISVYALPVDLWVESAN